MSSRTPSLLVATMCAKWSRFCCLQTEAQLLHRVKSRSDNCCLSSWLAVTISSAFAKKIVLYYSVVAYEFHLVVVTFMSKSMEYDVFPWLGDRKGIRPVKKTGCWFLITTTCIILCSNKHRLTQDHLENGR